MTSMHVTVSNDCGCRWQFWAHFVGGLGLRLLGCVVWFTVRLAATCLVMRQLVRDQLSTCMDAGNTVLFAPGADMAYTTSAHVGMVAASF